MTHDGTELIEFSKKDMYKKNYSIMQLKDYDKERHIKLEDAKKLVSTQTDLSIDEMISALDNNQINKYTFDKYPGQTFLDRLDVARIYAQEKKDKEGLTIERYFTDGKTNPFDTVGKISQRRVEITDYNTGKTIFEMNDAMFPEEWTDTQAQIVAQKYFFKPKDEEYKKKLTEKIGKPYEHSIVNLITRVTNFIADSGEELGYFKTKEDKEAFRDELAWLQINRKMAFNSPVQFNAGIYNEYNITGTPGINFWKDSQTGEVKKIEEGSYVKPQCHACFIKGPRDNLESIAQHVVDEIAVFSSGSGIGQDIGALRGANERLSGGGKSSGSMSFAKLYDQTGGVIKSGGKSRRAARMMTMRYNHPDISEFIRQKTDEDKKALNLMKNGWSKGMDGEAYSTVSFQNTNLSVRLDDEFFDALNKGSNVKLINVTDGKVAGEISADKMLKEISFGSWRIGDPAVQYESKIQEYHTVKNSGRNNSSNPCSEYLSLDGTSCNLASVNLVTFCDDKGNFDVKSYKRADKIISISLDIINGAASYPIKEIAYISPELRNIGLGYAGLGALLMRKGLAYDSDDGRALAGGLTAILTGAAYEQSAEMAEKLGTFAQYNFNKKPMNEVISKHVKNLDDVAWEHVPSEIKEEAYKTWNNVSEKGLKHGFRNSQATVLAPTGTISYLMGSEDSTGVEPAISLRIFKNLAGGGNLTLANKEVENALKNLGYNSSTVNAISKFVADNNTVIGAPGLEQRHYNIFDTAFGNKDGQGSISFEGHIGMLAATQPFISGAISKTNNMPKSATVKDIYDGYIKGYNLGLKAVSIFRNESKPIAALDFGSNSIKKYTRGEKEDLPDQRTAYEFELKIDGIPLHVIASEYSDGRVGQIMIESYKSGSTLGALLRGAGIQGSAALKRGIDLEVLTKGWRGQEFEPKGMVTGHPYIKSAASPLDLMAKIFQLEYLGNIDAANDPEKVDIKKLRGYNNGAFLKYARKDFDDWDINQVLKDPITGGFVEDKKLAELLKGLNIGRQGIVEQKGVPCTECGNPMKSTKANCYKCEKCGNTIGGCGL